MRADMLGSARQAAVASTGTLMVRGSALRVLTLMASVAVGFFLMPFLIHSLGDRWYGVWTLIGSITSYYALLDLGLMSAVGRFVTQAIARDEKANANAIIVTALVFLAGVGVVAFLVSVGVAASAAWVLDDPHQTIIFRQVALLLGADIALGFPLAAFGAVLGAHYRFDIECCVHLAALALRTALIVYFVGQGYSIVALALITLAVNLASRLAVAAAAWRLFPSLQLSRVHFHREQASILFGYGKHFFVAASADRIRFHVDTVVVAWFLGVSLVTHYAIAERLAQLFMRFGFQALGVIGPLFTRLDALGDRAKAQETLLLTTRISALASVMGAGCIVIFGERFVELWVGKDYNDAYWPLVTLTGSFMVALMQFPSVSFVYATARHRFFAYMNSAEAVVNFGLSVILVQAFGMIGVSLGTAIPLLVSNLVLPGYVCRTLGLNLATYFRNLCSVVLIAALSQVPLFAYMQRYDVSSLTAMSGIALCYYPLCGAILLRVVLGDSGRRRIADAVPALKWLKLG